MGRTHGTYSVRSRPHVVARLNDRAGYLTLVNGLAGTATLNIVEVENKSDRVGRKCLEPSSGLTCLLI